MRGCVRARTSVWVGVSVEECLCICMVKACVFPDVLNFYAAAKWI